MTVILAAFSLFHFMVGFASLALGLRLWSPQERALWRSPLALFVAELVCWIYPIAAFVSVRSAWMTHAAGEPHAFPLILVPILWLFVMGLVFAIVDFAEDGVLGNVRRRG